MSQIRPSHFLAASDALTKHIEVLKANNLENLAQLGQILEILPDLSKFSHLIAKAMKGDIGAIKELIDLIANEILKYKFSTKPTSGDASEILNTDVKKMLESITSVKRATLYGNFSYVFTDEENFMKDGRLTLTTRSKVRTYFDMSTLMVAYLTANSVGLLPTLERAWALLPFSFVIDWFTNMSKRLHLVDNQLLYAAVRVPWALHSYKVTYYPSDNALAEFNLINVDPDEPFGLSAYNREFTRYTPKLGESKFDFLRPTRGPDPVTVGALVWQYLF